MRTHALLALVIAATASARAEEAGNWTDLLAGGSLQAWVDDNGKALEGDKWIVEDGVLHLTGAGGGSIYTAKEYGDFELRWEWKIAPEGNSGVKYRMAKYEKGGLLGPEYQVYDDGGKPFEKGATASLYDILAPDKETKKLNPVGEWNTSSIVAKGGHLQHFLNGAKTIDITVGSPAWKEAVAQSKFKDVPGFAENAKGPIMLQDHGSEAWFRAVKIREL
jgi:hypothetical protein